MKNKLLRFSVLLLALALTLSACGGTEKNANITKLSFKQALGYDYLKKLDGTQVAINGYLATSSPVDGSFVFLMNMPYQNCPFCVPNTSQLANTMEVYPKSGETFSYTNQAVKVIGTLRVAPEGQTFSDLYGYEFSFKITDASYTILKDEDLSEELRLWQKFSATDVISEINRMYEYVNFLCAWNTYYVDSYDDGQGNVFPGYFLYSGDALNDIQEEGGQFNYGYQDGYFDKIIAQIQAIDPEAFQGLVQNVENAKALAADALYELESGHYSYEERYVEEFGTTDKVYAIDRGEELQASMNELFMQFSLWLGGWEL